MNYASQEQRTVDSCDELFIQVSILFIAREMTYPSFCDEQFVARAMKYIYFKKIIININARMRCVDVGIVIICKYSIWSSTLCNSRRYYRLNSFCIDMITLDLFHHSISKNEKWLLYMSPLKSYRNEARLWINWIWNPIHHSRKF